MVVHAVLAVRALVRIGGIKDRFQRGDWLGGVRSATPIESRMIGALAGDRDPLRNQTNNEDTGMIPTSDPDLRIADVTGERFTLSHEE